MSRFLNTETHWLRGIYDAARSAWLPSTAIETFPASQVDAFGRLRTSDPSNRFDCEFIYDKQPTLIDEVTAGSGSSATHNPASRDITIAIGNTTNGTSHALYSHYDIPYTPGNSHLEDITGTLDNAAIGGGTAFFFVRTTVTGTTAETTYQQSTQWDDPLADMDWSKSQILAIDFQSLKVGMIRFGFNRSGVAVAALSVENDNVRDTGYWQSPSLPCFWRIYNDDTYTYAEMGYGDTENAIGLRYRIAKNASATMRAICVTVKSEGGADIFSMPGYNRSHPMTASKTVSTTLIPLVSFDVAANFPTSGSIANRGVYIPDSFEITSDNPIRYEILYRPTLTGASFTAVNETQSGLRYDVTASAVSGGIRVGSGFISTARNTSSGSGGILGRTIMSLGRTGTSDILTIAAIRTGTNDASALASLTWREIR